MWEREKRERERERERERGEREREERERERESDSTQCEQTAPDADVPQTQVTAGCTDSPRPLSLYTHYDVTKIESYTRRDADTF